MPRNSSGVYSKPAGTTAVVDTEIDPTPWNTLTSDLGNEITNSLPRDGSAPMVAPLRAANGTQAVPSIAFSSDITTGIYRKATGVGALVAGGSEVLTWSSNGVDFENNVISNPAGRLLRGFISPGANLSNDATDAVNTIDFPDMDVASDETTPLLMSHSAGKAQLNFIFGGGNGGRFDASISDGTWHCFVISDGVNVKRGFSKSLDPTSAPNYPAGYTHYRRVASWLRESGSLIGLKQTGDLFERTAGAVDRSALTATSDVLLALSVPNGIPVRPILRSTMGISNIASWTNRIGSGSMGGTTRQFQQLTLTSANSAVDVTEFSDVVTDTSGRIWFGATQNSGASVSTNTLVTEGWYDTRGRL